MIILAALAAAAVTDGLQGPPKASDAVVLMAHWQCSTWAAMTNDDEAAAAHFQMGYDVGKPFVEAARAGAISSSEINETVPIYIATSLAGPNADFVMGGIQSMTADQAFDLVYKRDGEGNPLDPADYVSDSAVQRVIANRLLRDRNCQAMRTR